MNPAPQGYSTMTNLIPVYANPAPPAPTLYIVPSPPQQEYDLGAIPPMTAPVLGYGHVLHHPGMPHVVQVMPGHAPIAVPMVPPPPNYSTLSSPAQSSGSPLPHYAMTPSSVCSTDTGYQESHLLGGVLNTPINNPLSPNSTNSSGFSGSGMNGNSLVDPFNSMLAIHNKRASPHNSARSVLSNMNNASSNMNNNNNSSTNGTCNGNGAATAAMVSSANRAKTKARGFMKSMNDFENNNGNSSPPATNSGSSGNRSRSNTNGNYDQK
jgi:hypothetical protein